MSTVMSTPEDSTAGTSPATLGQQPTSARPQSHHRVLACVLCQRRKVKCDRKFPCANCIKSKVPCMPSTLVPRQRRRRYPERELLDRIREYEELLRHNNIKFEPLHKSDTANSGSPDHETGMGSDDERTAPKVTNEPSPLTADNSGVFEVRNIWHALNHDVLNDHDEGESDFVDVYENTVKDALHDSFEHVDHHLFGSRPTMIDLSTLHPDPVQIFRLWQIYLDNINPLLRITHTPTLQPRVIESAGNIKTIDPNLEALMFGIYSVSVFSLSPDECISMFGEPKSTLLMRYQFGCQQAMLKAGYSRTRDRDCLTGLYLYLISHRSNIDPRSLHSMLGVALRSAQRMGLHSESFHAKRTVLEAEMCRRLWWSLVLYDARITQLADCKISLLDPTWDCKIPLNVNEADLRPEMKEPPMFHGDFSEAIFAVVRCELGDFLRYAPFHLDFTNPALKTVAKECRNSASPNKDELSAFENRIENKYLKFCDPENPLHYATIWTTRATLAKYKLIELHWRLLDQSEPRTDEQRDTLDYHALKWLESDSKLFNPRLIKGFHWLADFYFPFPAYFQIISDLKRRPFHAQSERFWEAMSENFTSRWTFPGNKFTPILKMFSDMVFRAWEAREAFLIRKEELVEPPGIVSYLRSKILTLLQNEAAGYDTMTNDIDSLPMSIPADFGNINMQYQMAMQDRLSRMDAMGQPDMPIPLTMDPNMNQYNWATMNWDLVDFIGLP